MRQVVSRQNGADKEENLYWTKNSLPTRMQRREMEELSHLQRLVRSRLICSLRTHSSTDMSHSHNTIKKPIRHDSFSRQVTETSPQTGLSKTQMN